MMAVVIQLVSFLLISVSITVSVDIFKLVNTSVQLDVQKNVEFDHFTWTFNRSDNVVRYYKNSNTKVSRGYKDKVEFNEETLSLTLKNIQKNDSGLYEAVAAEETSKTVATYQLHVLDPVENPVLKVSHQETSDTCIVAFTCEAQKLSITSHCYNDICNKEKKNIYGESHSSLSVYFTNRLIICNQSNPVSWKHITMEMEETVGKYCPSKGVNMLTYCVG